LDTAWDKILESLNSAEDWENLTPEQWEAMLKPPAFFQSIPTLPIETPTKEKSEPVKEPMIEDRSESEIEDRSSEIRNEPSFSREYSHKLERHLHHAAVKSTVFMCFILFVYLMTFKCFMRSLHRLTQLKAV
jgi:Fe2+ transport system protein B